MKTLVGIDEAGYGPVLGPLVLGLSAFRFEARDRDLYRVLSPVVARRGASCPQRLAVDDSKRLFAGRRSLLPLELGALAFLAPGGAMPDTLERLAADRPGSSGDGPPWYRRPPVLPEIPAAVTLEAVQTWRARLARRLPELGVQLVACQVVAVLEEPFNRSLRRTGNKATTLSTFLAPLLRNLARSFPEGDLEIRVDRLGGRRYYESFLASLFPLQPLKILTQDRRCSAYELQERSRRILIAFETESDATHLPVALSSMCAKYVRELFLRRLNHHFATLVPGLRPTAGYPGDATRFLDEIAPVLDQCERVQLIRQR